MAASSTSLKPLQVFSILSGELYTKKTIISREGGRERVGGGRERRKGQGPKVANLFLPVNELSTNAAVTHKL